jgi:hypothetical protein
MSEDFEIDKDSQGEQENESGTQERKVIDEANYKVRAPRENGPTAVGRGGDPLFRRIRATKEQLIELMEETQTVQDWVQRETSNNVALSCLENEDLKEIYFAIKDGFGEYGRISLMGYKTPYGVEIPRLKIYDKNGEVIEVLTGPMAIDELNRRAVAYKNTQKGYEALPIEGNEPQDECVIGDYSGNPDDYVN